jgi:hypothetical protein
VYPLYLDIHAIRVASSTNILIQSYNTGIRAMG